MPDQDNIEPESTYPALEKPDFKSDIPPHLVKDVGESERYILEQLSILSQYVSWSVKAQMDTNSAVRRTNGRLIKVERWKTMLQSWWALVMVVMAVLGGLGTIISVADFFVKVIK
jgi:hypothetical protein